MGLKLRALTIIREIVSNMVKVFFALNGANQLLMRTEWKEFSPESLTGGPFADLFHFLCGLAAQQKAYQNDKLVY